MSVDPDVARRVLAGNRGDERVIRIIVEVPVSDRWPAYDTAIKDAVAAAMKEAVAAMQAVATAQWEAAVLAADARRRIHDQPGRPPS